MMKQLFMFLFVLVLVFGLSLQAQADLFNRGTDINGNRLIYDSDLNITWYDYTNSHDTWYKQMNWADALSVSGGDLVGVYDDWRLPTTLQPDLTCSSQWPGGNYSSGYNCTGSEMGHLYYTELRNKEKPGGFTNTGDFQHLLDYALPPNTRTTYYSRTEYSSWQAHVFRFTDGIQDGTYSKENLTYAIAVRPGDVAVVPEPISSILFLTGGATFIGRKYLRRKK